MTNLLNLSILMSSTIMLLTLFLYPKYNHLNKMHPLQIIFIVILFTILLTCILNYLFSSPWYSLIMFMAMISGMMILFMYLISMTSMNTPPMSIKLLYSYIYKMVMFSSMFYMYIIFFDTLILFLILKFPEMAPSNHLMSTLILYSSSLYSFKTFKFSLFMMSYLIFNMLISTKMSLLLKKSSRLYNK